MRIMWQRQLRKFDLLEQTFAAVCEQMESQIKTNLQSFSIKFIVQYRGHLDNEGLKRKFAIIKKHCDDVGRDYDSIWRTVIFNCAIAETDEEAFAKSKAFHRNIPSGRFREQALVGKHDTIRQRLEEIEQAGTQEIIIYMPDAAQLEPVRMFAHECIQKQIFWVDTRENKLIAPLRALSTYL